MTQTPSSRHQSIIADLFSLRPAPTIGREVASIAFNLALLGVLIAVVGLKPPVLVAAGIFVVFLVGKLCVCVAASRHSRAVK